VPFVCTVEQGTCTAWVQLTGELDLLTAPVLQRHLREALAHATLVVIDLRQLSFIDATGVHVICNASERADAEGRRLMVLRGPAQVDRLFTLTSLSEKLAMFDVARHDGNLTPIKTPRSTRDCVNATDEGKNHADGITPATLHANNGSTPRMPTAPRFCSTPQLTSERDGAAR
jgi:anti-sigma B factor antagonist